MIVLFAGTVDDSTILWVELETSNETFHLGWLAWHFDARFWVDFDQSQLLQQTTLKSQRNSLLISSLRRKLNVMKFLGGHTAKLL